MRVGLTYNLKQDYEERGFDPEAVAEFDPPEVIEAIESALRSLGYVTERIGGVRGLVERLARGDRWDLVFNIAEGFRGSARESQVPGLLEAYDIPFVFSDALTLALTLHKPTAKRIVLQHGLPTPAFRVVERPEQADEVDLPMPVFVKPVSEGSSKGIRRNSLVQERRALRDVCAAVIRVHRQPALVETFLPGREFTVGVVGTGEAAEALGVLEIGVHPDASFAYSFEVKTHPDYHEIVDYRLPGPEMTEACVELALGAWRALECRDGGRVDLRVDADDRPSFLEVNPLAGLHPVDSDLTILTGLLGISYEELIRRIMASAHVRLGRPMPAVAAAPSG